MDQSVRPIDLFKVLCVVCIWGFNFVAIKFTVADVPPIAMTFMRFLFTAIILSYLFRPHLDMVKKMFPIAMVMGIGHFGMLYIGVSGVDGATAAILIQLGTPFSVILAILVFKEHLALVAGVGLLLSFSGAVFLSGEPQGGGFWSVVIIICSAFCWAWANILIKKIDAPNPLVVIFWMNFLALPGLFILSAFFETEQIAALISAPLSAWLGLTYTILCSSLFAYFLWYQLLSQYNLNKIVPYSIAVPLVGVGSTVIILGEALTIYKVIGGLFTITGVGLIYFSQRRQKTQKI